jgi:hypothetical protein
MRFIIESCTEVNKIYGDKYKWGEFPILDFIDKHYFTVCFNDGVPVGFLAASIFKSFFDPNVIVLKQNLLFALPKTRACYHLMKDFIDFGKSNANHIITMIGTETKINAKSLEKLGFKQLEVLYRMEV